MDYQAIIAGTVGKENTFGTCEGLVKAGAMSSRDSLPMTQGRIWGYTGGGRFTDDPLETFGGAGVVEIPPCKNCSATSAKTALSITSQQTSSGSPASPGSHHALSRLERSPPCIRSCGCTEYAGRAACATGESFGRVAGRGFRTTQRTVSTLVYISAIVGAA